MLLSVRIPPGSERGPHYMDQTLAAMHHAIQWRDPLILVIGRFGDHTGLGFECSQRLKHVVHQQLSAQYPECEIQPTLAQQRADHGTAVWSMAVRLSPDVFPLKTYRRFEDLLKRTTADPLASLLAAIGGDDESPFDASIIIRVRPARRRVVLCARRIVRDLDRSIFHLCRRAMLWYARGRRSGSRLRRIATWGLGRMLALVSPRGRHRVSSAEGEHLKRATEKLDEHLFEATVTLRVAGPPSREREARHRLHGMLAALGTFNNTEFAAFRAARIRRSAGAIRCGSPFLLSAAELATLWHPASETVQTPSLAMVLSRELEPPVELPLPEADPDIAVLGEALSRQRPKPFGLLPDDRRRHLAILGKTGMGKSTLLQTLITADIAAGHGIAVIDPHGDLAEAVLQSVPSFRTNDVVLFDAADASHPVAFNPLACPEHRQRPLVAGAVLSTFKKLYGESWGPRLEHILRNTLFTLLDVPNASLALVPRLLTDVRFRQQAVARVSDPVVRDFWSLEFAQLAPKLQAEAVSPILNKVGQFLTNPLLRSILGQPESRLELRAVMDERKILLVNLSKGRLGDDASTLLGSFLITAVQLAAMSRADVPESNRSDFHLYVDEFGCFATEAFAGILSEARKYRLNLILANQYLAQLSESTLAAVFGNVGSLLVFQVGAQDAPTLAEQLGSPVEVADLLMVPKFQAYVRLLIDGQPTRSFSMRTIPPAGKLLDPRRAEIIRRVSRRRYTRPAARVAGNLAAIHNTKPVPTVGEFGTLD